jgi:hypothetical protein
MPRTLGQAVPRLDVGRVRARETTIDLARAAFVAPRMQHQAADQPALAGGQPRAEPLGGVRMALALGRTGRRAPAERHGALVVRQRERAVERQRRREPGARFVHVEAVERRDALEVFLICLDAVGAERGTDLGARRWRDVEDLLCQPTEERHDGVLDRALLYGAEPLARSDVEDLGRDGRASADLEQVTHDEASRARVSGDVERRGQRRRLGRVGAALTQQVDDTFVVHDAHVAPARHVEVQHVDRRASQPIDALGSPEVVEGDDDPRLVVETRRCAARRDLPARRR